MEDVSSAIHNSNVANVSNSNGFGWFDIISGNADTIQQQQDFNAKQTALEREYNAAEAKKAREYNAAEAQKAREWEEKMSNTSYQRMMADAKKAGINPLNLIGASGASTGSGTAASASAASSGSASSSFSSQNGIPVVAKAVYSAASLLLLAAKIGLI